MSSYYCRLCSTSCTPDESSLFNKQVIEMVEYCIPEFDITLMNNPIICGKCNALLKQYTDFKKKCMEVQDHMKHFLMKKKSSDGTISINSTASSEKCSVDESPTIDVANVSFDDSYRKFLQTNSQHLCVNTVHTEVSICTSESENLINDEFFNLLESSSNIKKSGANITNLHKADNRLFSNFYDDSSRNESSSSASSIIENKVKKKKSLSKFPKIKSCVDSPLNVEVDMNTCVTCSANFPSLVKLLQHLYTVHQKSEEKLRCMLCRYTSDKLMHIISHYTKAHMDCSNLKATCLFCSLDYQNFDNLFIHIRSKHKKNYAGRYKCNSCSFRSRNYEIFRKHFILSHELICQFCCKDCDSHTDINNHLGHHFNVINRKKKTISNLSC